MKRFGSEELRIFLKALDQNAPKGSSVVIIGGAAAALSAFGPRDGTTDIDTANNIKDLGEAIEAAKRKTGLEIPFAQSTVVEAPSGYKSRLRRVVLKGLKNLTILVPEKHDWALMNPV